MKLILVAQGRTLWDDEARLQGTIDVPLSPRGRKELPSLARKLRAFRPMGVIAGSAQTPMETARILAREFGCRLRTTDQLNDLDCGLWQGMRLSELEARYGHTFRRWRRNPHSVSPPKGESMSEMLKRVGAVLEQVRRRRRQETVIMVLPDMLHVAVRALVAGVSLETIWSTGPSREPWTGLDI